MIIENQAMVTDAVIAAVSRVEDARLREILTALVRHLHGLVRDTSLTEREFQEAVRLIVAMGQKTTPSHNEVVLMAGSLGVSSLVCLLNNGNQGESETLDINGNPIAGAEVDVWHSSPEGLYENQDPGQAEMNLRGRFISDEAGRFHFRSVKPAGYPIPVDGPVGEFVRATRRHNYRPAHLHFMICKAGFKTLISQIYSPDDPHLDSDVQFGVTRALIGDYIRHDQPSSELGFAAPWYSLDQHFALERGEARRPEAPIRAKAPEV
jgi:Dioxygenase/Catechol dioxygenase N terminus